MKTTLRMLVEARKYWNYLFLSILSIAGLTAGQLIAPLVVRELTSLVTSGASNIAERSLQMAIFLCIIYLLQSACSGIRSYLTHYAAWHFVSDMRVKLYDHFQKLSLSYYHDKQTGQLMSRVIADTANLETLIAHAAPDMIVNIIIFSGVSIILFTINVKLAFMALISIPFIMISSIWFAKHVRPQFKKGQEAVGELSATLQDNISGMREIQVFNQQEKEKKRIEKASKTYANAILHALRLSALYHPAIQFFSSMGTVFVIGYGGYLASVNQIPISDIVAFILYLGIFYQPVAALARVNEDLQNALAGANRVFEVLDSESDVKEIEKPMILSNVKGHIEYKNVSFHYDEGTEVLADINLNVNPGQVVALVGPTGVGKTTMVSLLNRFYDTVEGTICIDNTDIKNVTLRSLRDSISMVLQDVFLFNGTIADNIAYGNEDATRQQILEAAKMACAHDFIENMEQGYDTYIGERGVKLSGGQKQRISIARAVLRNKPILILDEATAAVDVETEKLIHEAMDRVMVGRTTIIIAHRLSTVKKADTIIVLNEGGVVEMGTHEALLSQNGFYAHLCNIQIK